MSEQCGAYSDFTIDLDPTLPPSVATGDKSQTVFTLKNPNFIYQAHLRINGEIRFILSDSFANFVDQESLVNKTAAI